MATKTLTMATTGGPSCNGRLTTTETIQVMYPPGGIFGWKKRTLYLLLILLVSVVLIDMILILWIIKILDLTSEGPGKIRISQSGLQVDSDAEFIDTLSARQIIAQQHHSLKIESSRNVTLMAADERGFFTNILSLGEAGLQSIGNYFTVLSTLGHELLHVDSQEMVVAANHMVVSDSGGLRLDGSLETPLVRGGATKDLRLESLLKKVKIRSDGAMNVDSPAGGIFVTGLKTMNLKSTGGKVIIDSNRLKMMNLKTSRQTSKEKNHQVVYQVCVCDNGRVFLAHREGHCQIHASVCKEQEDTRQNDKYQSWKSYLNDD
ncbi:delta-sarcoglycan-like [Uloborus diversus]|uniref:delta-sarcoglycan-like n=1 Tax=Uloborus diversus TaxID=327109 RepID=UPI002409AABD|nr:delta-sarcoglycan-like [Uloborus diversus]